jgi:hypothetical protein
VLSEAIAGIQLLYFMGWVEVGQYSLSNSLHSFGFGYMICQMKVTIWQNRLVSLLKEVKHQY